MRSNSHAFMKFDLDPMIEEMRDMVSRWAADKLAPRAAEIDEKNLFPRDLWPELGELGLLGITADEEFVRDHDPIRGNARRRNNRRILCWEVQRI